MVQRKVPSKLGVQADHVKSDKRLANLKITSSQHQDGKTRGADMKKKTKKSRSIINLSDLEALKTSPSKRSPLQPGKPPPLHVSTTAAATSPQKQLPLMKTNYGSPNYMKPTSSSDAKKELFPVSLRNTHTGSDIRNQKRRISSISSKDSSVSARKSTKALTKSSSLKLVRTLTKTPSFKISGGCPRKSSRVALYADINAQRATCSSTLKESKFPSYLMLNPGGTESEGTSVMKVCPYTYCSLNGHCHAPLPPLKSFLSARRRMMKTQKNMKLEALSPRKLKITCEKKEDSDSQQNGFNGKPAYDEVDTANLAVTTLVQEIGMDFFIEIYANRKEDSAEKVLRNINSVKELDDQVDNKSTIEDISMAVQVLASVSDGSPKSEIDFEEDFKIKFDDVMEEVNKNDFLQEQNAGYADEEHQAISCHEETSKGSYCSKSNYEGEKLDNGEMDSPHSEGSDMEWDEEQFCASECEEDVHSYVLTEDDVDSYVLTEEEADTKCESSSESSHDMSVMWLDDVLSSYFEDFLTDDVLQDANAEKSSCIQPQGSIFVQEDRDESMQIPESGDSSNNESSEQSCLTEILFQEFENVEENGREDAMCEDDQTNCPAIVLDEVLGDMQQKTSLQEGTSISLDDQISDASRGCYEVNLVKEGSRIPKMESTETYQDVGSGDFKQQQELLASESDTAEDMEKEAAADVTKMQLQSYGNHFSQDSCEADTVDNGQGQTLIELSKIVETTGDRKAHDGSLNEEAGIHLSGVHNETTNAVPDQELMEKDQGKANKHRPSCKGGEEQNTTKNWKEAIRRKRPVQDDEEDREFNPRRPNFLPLVPDPETEKVDLKHQMMDDRKNAEEWMLDYALRQAVTKLAPARKRKVALLVEAFETVMPISKYETHLRNNSTFPHARQIQACS